MVRPRHRDGSVVMLSIEATHSWSSPLCASSAAARSRRSRSSTRATTEARLGVSLAFYSALGAPIPEGVESEGHADARLDDGTTLAWDAFWGQRYATALDPDGNAVDLFAVLPSH